MKSSPQQTAPRLMVLVFMFIMMYGGLQIAGICPVADGTIFASLPLGKGSVLVAGYHPKEYHVTRQ
ncbi:hypothetical protein [Bacteroides clarus]